MFFTILVFAAFITIVVIVCYIIFSGENDYGDTTLCNTCLYNGINEVCEHCIHKNIQNENKAVEEIKPEGEK